MQLWAPSLGLSVLHMVTHCPNEIPIFLFIFKLILSLMSVEKLRTSVVKLDNCSFWNINHEEWNCEHFQMTTRKLKNNNHVVEKNVTFSICRRHSQKPLSWDASCPCKYVMSWFIHQRSNTFAKPYHFLVTFKLYPGTVANLFTLDYT